MGIAQAVHPIDVTDHPLGRLADVDEQARTPAHDPEASVRFERSDLMFEPAGQSAVIGVEPGDVGATTGTPPRLKRGGYSRWFLADHVHVGRQVVGGSVRAPVIDDNDLIVPRALRPG